MAAAKRLARNWAGTVALLALTATAGLAEAPSTSVRPLLRPVAVAAGGAVPAVAPVPKPGSADTVVAEPATTEPSGADVVRARVRQADEGRVGRLAPVAPLAMLSRSLRPKLRPEGLTDSGALERVTPVVAVRPNPGAEILKGAKGSVCGDPSIKGERLAPIVSRVKGCGVADPVKVTSIDGVRLSMAATIDCDTARALKDWVATGLKPAMAPNQVTMLEIAGSYTCRPRNNVAGGKISEHGRGRAVDVSAIRLASGSTLSVLKDWRSRSGKAMQRAYRAACGTFHTTLGPGSDGYHEDHMHFDTAQRRSGAYCR